MSKMLLRIDFIKLLIFHLFSEVICCNTEVKNQFYGDLNIRDSLSQAYETSPPVLCCDSSICKNSSDQPELNEQSLGDGLSSRMINCYIFLRIFRMKNWSIIIETALMILELVVISVWVLSSASVKGCSQKMKLKFWQKD